MNENFRFKDLPYVRPDFAKVKTELAAITEKMKNAASYEEAKAAYFDFESIMSDLRDAYTIVSIRHTVDTRDKFYDDENEFLSEAFPELSPYTVAFSNALYDGKFKADFEKEFGKQLLSMIELERKSFSEKNIPLQQKEAKLCNEYEKIIASAEIDFDGEKRNLYGVMKYFEDEDREVRKAAWKKYEEFFASHEKRFEEIWDELIKVRNEQGRNLGFENFIPLGYMQQGRTDYNAADVASFREQVKEELVPLCSKLYEAQAKRLNLDKVRVYDENCVFADGNAERNESDCFLQVLEAEFIRFVAEEFFRVRICELLHAHGVNFGYVGGLGIIVGDRLITHCLVPRESVSEFVRKHLNISDRSVKAREHERGFVFKNRGHIARRSLTRLIL